MRIRLLVSLGGHRAGTVLDHDHSAGAWLIAAALAIRVADVNTDTTGTIEDVKPPTPRATPKPGNRRRSGPRRSS